MPKRTRSNEEKIKYYKNKIKRLKTYRRIIISDSEEEQCETIPDNNLDLNITPANEEVDSTPEPRMESSDVSPSDSQTNQLLDAQPDIMLSQENIEVTTATTADSAPPESTEPTETELDPLLLMALGESTTDSPEFGDKIHENLAQLWNPILKKGIPKDTKQKLLRDHLVPDNCRLLQAPKLNAEITAACAESVRSRDKKYLAIQQQLGQGIAAVNRGMHSLLKSDDKIECLKYFSDSCRILTDLHFAFTKDRIKLITPSVDKKYLHVLQDTERDETLFGTSLSEKIKASSAIDKQGLQIKKTLNTRTTTMTTGIRVAVPAQGNYPGPSRYPSNRGGRGGPRKTFQPPTSRRPFNQPPAPQPRLPYQNRPRAPAQQQQ